MSFITIKIQDKCMYLAIINETAAYCGGEGIWYDFWEKEIAWLIVIIYATFIAFMFFKRSAQEIGRAHV